MKIGNREEGTRGFKRE